MTEPTPDDRMPGPAADLIGSLVGEIDTVIAPLIPADRPVALLDFPVYSNVGDSAIWLGALASLRRRGIRTLCYSCSFKNYSRRDLERRIGDGTIVLSGGGNFGDRYEPHQRLREEVIAAFPNHRIVQLSQSIWFRSGEALDRSRRLLGRHRDLTLLVRDWDSLAIAKRDFAEVRSLLCPDLALGLGPLANPRPHGDRIVWLSRADSESTGGGLRAPKGIERRDWGLPPDAPHQRWLNRFHRRLRSHPSVIQWFYAPIARERLRRGIALLAGSRCVITDRLHGHILCMLLGIPHFLLPNTNGKVRAFYETWTRSSSLVRWSDRESEALELALAGRQESR